jgi:hypothetical protein
MPGARDHLDQTASEPARSRKLDAAPDRDVRPTITGAADPRLAVGGSGSHADLMHVQRTAGNAAVASLVAPSVQRVVTLDEMTSEVDAAAPPSGGGSPEGAASADAGAAADAGGEADHTITAAHIGLNAPIVEASGILRAQTVIADSIVASSYTPGAGNQW